MGQRLTSDKCTLSLVMSAKAAAWPRTRERVGLELALPSAVLVAPGASLAARLVSAFRTHLLCAPTLASIKAMSVVDAAPLRTAADR
jgi:hypothetical protein